MKNILLTGGSGFIGKNILESSLNQKYELFAPTHSQLDLVDENSVKHFFKDKYYDVILHSATKPGHRNAKDPTNIYFTDMKMFFNLMHFKDHFDKLILFGSGAIYDTRRDILKLKEDEYLNSIPSDEHGFYRYCCAKYLENSTNIYELRIFGIFGKYEDYAIRFISNAICKSIFSLPITIKQNRKFDYLWINDLMPILEHFIESDPHFKTYNITPNNSIELLKIAEMVRTISQKQIPITVANDGMGLEYSGDNTRLRNEIKTLSYTDLSTAIQSLYTWYSVNKSTINKEVLLYDK